MKRIYAVLLVCLALGVLMAFPSLSTPVQAATGTWTATGSLQTARDGHTATLLPNGRVLVAGGATHGGPGGVLASAELYNPATGSWTATGSMLAARWFHTATLLANGRVLVVGGQDNNLHGQSTAELYDPATGTWTATGSMQSAHYRHTATLLPNGRVLVAGGADQTEVIMSTAELYDPATGSWTPTGSMHAAHYLHTATLLPNGLVLVAGGADPSAEVAELYDPATGRPLLPYILVVMVTRRPCWPMERSWSLGVLTTVVKQLSPAPRSMIRLLCYRHPYHRTVRRRRGRLEAVAIHLFHAALHSRACSSEQLLLSVSYEISERKEQFFGAERPGGN
jgi:WD40 repeat protein